MVTQANEHTTWISEYLIKNQRDIDLIGEFVTCPLCDVEASNEVVQEYGERGMVRSDILSFDVFGQPGCWQDACCLYPAEQMILATYDDPNWVHEFLKILQRRKKVHTQSMAGANFDLLGMGGG